MKTILLVMGRKVVAQGLMFRTRGRSDLRFRHESDYARAGEAAAALAARTALIEVAESGEYDTDYCLRLCAGLKKTAPLCKVLLLCPERDKDAVARAVQARSARLIDDFLFYDSSVDYLISKLWSL